VEGGRRKREKVMRQTIANFYLTQEIHSLQHYDYGVDSGYYTPQYNN